MWCSAIGCIVMLILSLLVAPLATEAQLPSKVPRIGFLMPLLTPERAHTLEAFRHRLRELGWIEGQNVAMELRYAEAGTDTARLPDLAADLVRLNVDVIVTVGGTTRIAQSATRTIPIVMVEARDPVEAGYVTSLAQPGGNITGLAGLGAELSGKRLEILKQVVPPLSRVALLLNPTLGGSAAGNVRETQRAAQALGVAVQVLEVRRPEDIEGAFAAVPQAGAGALLLLTDPRVLEPHLHNVVALALQSRLPAIYPWRMYVEAGGLMSYGISLQEWYRRAATYVDKILKGAKPGDLPVEQPMQFEFIINLKTAQALGIMIPPSLLILADEVIK
jgi:putative tryptophan/tyrosine transport system substrate-binding protein